MAFYISRIDDNGQEIDRISMSTSRTVVQEKNLFPMDTSSMRPRMMSPSAEYVSGFGDFDSEDSDSSNSTLRDRYTYRGNEFIPPLDIQSVIDAPTETTPVYSYHIASSNADSDINRAYESWLAKKVRVQTHEATRHKQEQKRRQQEEEDRKRLSEIKYQNWLEKKRNMDNAPVKPKKQQKQCEKTTRSMASSVVSSSKSSVSSIASDGVEKQRKIVEWQRSKRKQEESRRLAEKKRTEERDKLAAKRKEESSAAYDRWVAKSKNRPRPVPLNQGMLSLRGTISDIFVNPNEWKSILE